MPDKASSTRAGNLSLQRFEDRVGARHFESARCLDAERFDDTVIDHHGIALGAHAHAGTGQIELEPLYPFRMRGIGYTHPVWSHGSIHGELEVGGEAIAVADFAPLDPSSIHVQLVCRARMGDQTGVGVLEQACFGEHAPTGLTGLFDAPVP